MKTWYHWHVSIAGFFSSLPLENIGVTLDQQSL